jgi:hypothetical protein
MYTENSHTPVLIHDDSPVHAVNWCYSIGSLFMSVSPGGHVSGGWLTGRYTMDVSLQVTFQSAWVGLQSEQIRLSRGSEPISSRLTHLVKLIHLCMVFYLSKGAYRCKEVIDKERLFCRTFKLWIALTIQRCVASMSHSWKSESRRV